VRYATIHVTSYKRNPCRSGPLTENIVRIATEKRQMASNIGGNVERLAAIKSLSLVKMERTATGKNRITTVKTIANEKLTTAIF